MKIKFGAKRVFLSIIRKIKGCILKTFASKKYVEFDLNNTRSVLFLRYDKIGDMIVTTPVFRELKSVYPQVKIIVLASEINKNVLNNNPYVDEIYINHKDCFLKDLSILLKLRRMSIDVAIEFDHSVVPHAIFRLKLINPKKVISAKKDGRYGIDGDKLSLYDFYTNRNDIMHFRDIWLNTLNPFGIIAKSNDYEVYPSESSFMLADNFCFQFDRKIKVGINLEGSSEDRKINIDTFKDICLSLKKIYSNIQIILISAPSKYDYYCSVVDNINLEFVEISYKTDSILDVCALISKMDLIISPDTSVVHIASLYNVPIISFYKNDPIHFSHFAPVSDFQLVYFFEIFFESHNISTFVGQSFKKFLDLK